MFISIIFMLLILVFLISSILSLIFPTKFASYLPKAVLPRQTRLAVFSRYFILMVISFLALIAVIPKDSIDNETYSMGNNEVTKTENSITVTESTPKDLSVQETTEPHSVVKINDKPKPKTEVEIEAEIAELKQDFSKLFDELMGFKDNKKFHEFGFGQGGAYSSWLEQVRSMDKKYKGMLQIQTGLLFGELAQVGLDYMRSKGTETEYTSFTVPNMQKALGR